MISPTVCADAPARRTRTSAARRTSRIRAGFTPFDLLACRPRPRHGTAPYTPVERTLGPGRGEAPAPVTGAGAPEVRWGFVPTMILARVTRNGRRRYRVHRGTDLGWTTPV